MRLKQLLFLILSITSLSVLGQNKTGTHKMHSNIKSLFQGSSSAKTVESKFIDRSVIQKQDKVLLEITAQNEIENTVAALNNLGVEVKAKAGRKVSAWVSLSQLEDIANLQEVRWIQGVNKAAAVGGIGRAETTSVEQDGFSAIFENYGILGEDVTVGVVSTSYNNQNGEVEGIAGGDLPGAANPNGYTKPVVIVEEATEDVTNDEGRAMIEIIHDLAPAADFLFIAGLNGRVSYADAIGRLVDAGADVVVSDINYANAPFYLDGMEAKAYDAAFEQGIPVVQHAGNFRTNAYESQFVNSDSLYRDEVAHDFDPGPGVDITQTISIPSGSARLSLQWDDPWFTENGIGTDTDMSIHFLDETGAYLATVSDDNIQSGDPQQFVSIADLTITTLQIIITKKVGPDPGLIKYLLSDPSTIDEHATNSPTIFGSQNSKTIISVGGNAQSNPTERYFFSSIGGAQLLFDNDGNRLAEPLIRNLPTITATQGTNTTFFGLTGIDDVEGDGFPNFYGTSAASAHVGGLVALMLECNNSYTPTEIKELLINTALDYEAPGFDFNTGYGYWNPEEVLKTCVDENEPVDPDPPVDPNPVDPDTIPTFNPLDFFCKSEHFIRTPGVVNIQSNSVFVISSALFGAETQMKKSEDENWSNIEGQGGVFYLQNLEDCTEYDLRNYYPCTDGDLYSDVVSFTTGNCEGCNVGSIEIKARNNGFITILTWDIIPSTTYLLYYKLVEEETWNVYETPIPFALLFNEGICETKEFYVEAVCQNDDVSLPSNIVLFEGNNCKTGSINALDQTIPIQVYPNPATSYIYVGVNNIEPSIIQIYNSAGSLVKEIKNSSSLKNNRIDINNLNNGVYYLNIKTAKQNFSAKFMKE